MQKMVQAYGYSSLEEAEKEMAIEEQKEQNRYDVIQKVLEYRQKEN